MQMTTCTRQTWLSKKHYLFPVFDQFRACCCTKQIDISFLCISPLIEDEFRQNIVKVFNLSSKLGLAHAA